jgi:flagellar motor switch protein FliN/FliY
MSQEADIKTEMSSSLLFDPNKMGILNEVNIVLTIEVGRAQIKIKDLLSLTKDSVIDLNKSAGDPVDVYANGKLISQGNIITVNGKYCVRLTAIPEKSEL